MKGSTDNILDKMRELLDDISIDDFLRWLIEDSDEIEVACCLDMILKKKSRYLRVYDYAEGGQIYPSLTILS